MTIHGWDASHYDWDRGPMDMAAAVADGIAFATHKIGEGSSYTDPRFAAWYKRARAAGVPLPGAYYVNHRGDQQAQADRFIRLLDDLAPGWRDSPFILQVDAERWHRDDGSVYAYEPRPEEVRAFCDRLVARTAGRFRPLVYAPKWVYGETLKGLPYPLWASSYGNNPVVPYRSAYPGDGSGRWAAYSGQVPAILQYGSKAKIGSQPTCDANAYRGTLAQLVALVTPQQTIEEDIVATLEDVRAAVRAEMDRVASATVNTRQPIDAYGPGGRQIEQYDGWGEHGLALLEAVLYVIEWVRPLPGQVAALRTEVATLTGRDPLDEADVAARILAVLTPEAIAQSVPPEVAQQVVDLLAARMAE